MIPRWLRLVLALAGMALLVMTYAFFKQMTWATGLLPFEERRLTNIFYASIWIAIAGPVLWIAWKNEAGALVGGALNLVLTSADLAVFMLQSYLRDPDTTHFLLAALAFGTFAIVDAISGVWAMQHPIRDPRPMPVLVRLSFAVFAVVLILVGGGLVFKVKNIIPWPFVHAGTSVMVGWIFMGASICFIYGVVRPSWHNAAGQLIGFLLYDLILIEPFIRHLDTVRPDLRDNLMIYLGVVVYSGLLAIYYLFIHPPTRLWRMGTA